MMKFYLHFIALILFPQFAMAQVTLSEIMFDPPVSEYYYEFIEICNLSTSDSIDLTGWKISDGLDTDKIIAAGQRIKIAPRQFAIVLDPGYFDQSRIYDSLIPQNALILTIDGSTFGNNGLSNSTPEKVSLITAGGDTASSYTYTLDNAEGYSDEKIELDGEDISQNWANSRTSYGTPGAANSVSPVDFDLAIRLSYLPLHPNADSLITLTGTVFNSGVKPSADFILSYYHDENADSMLRPEEIIASPFHIADAIQPQDSLIITLPWKKLSGGMYRVAAQVDFSLDQNSANDQDFITISVGYNPLDLVINEIMYRPLANQAEWLEIHNPTLHAIDIRNWKFSDSHINARIQMTDDHYRIPPGAYIVLAEDRTIFDSHPSIPCTTITFQGNFPTLNDTYDTIILYDQTDQTIDRVDYQSSWGKEYGVSLERIRPLNGSNDPENWTLNQNTSGATPGEKNSASPRAFDLSISAKDITFIPPVPLKGTRTTILIKIKNSGLENMANFQVGFYHDQNFDSTAQSEELIDVYQDISAELAPEDSIILSQDWSGFQPGLNQIIVSLSSAQDQNTDNNVAVQILNIPFDWNQIIINEIMFSPLSGHPEWIEIMNLSEQPVIIEGWSISDSDTSSPVVFGTRSFFIQPDSFWIIAADSLPGNLYSTSSKNIRIVKNFPSLNNDADRVHLYDLSGKIIDSVPYRSSWGGGQGISLERIQPRIASEDSLNWSSCVLPEGGTPGQRNSIYVRNLPAGSALSISPNPFSPDADGRDDVTIISVELPVTTATMNVKIYDIRGRLVRFLGNNQETGALGSLIWDGRDDHGDRCRIGIYIVYLEALNASKGIILSQKKTVVLAAQL